MILIAFWQRLGIPEKLIRDPAYDEILPLNTELGRLVLENYLQDDIHKWTIWLILAVSIAFIDSVMVVGGWPAPVPGGNPIRGPDANYVYSI